MSSIIDLINALFGCLRKDPDVLGRSIEEVVAGAHHVAAAGAKGFEQILNLIFASGFSTAEKVSDVSGRGVGMDVVKSKIAEIRGEVTVDAEVGKGTTITMELPLTLSIIDGLLTRIGGEQFVFPFTNVERILQPEEVKMSDSGMGDFFTYNGDQLVSIDLNKIFNGRPTEFANSKMLIVGQGDKRVGMVVDAVLGEFQIVVKPLGRFLRSVDMISGASVMGDGSLSLIIDPGRLVNYFNQSRLRKKAASAAGASNA